MRLQPILAIAQRDLRSELKGRAGLGLPIVTLGLLLPLALIGAPPDALQELPVRGDVPEVIRDLPHVVESNRGTGFVVRDGIVLVFDYTVEPAFREALDAGEPAVTVQALHPPTRIPGRTLLLALVSASTLTGAVSSSIGGERARHTLQALLSAAVTRLEVVLGKWLGWSAFGTIGALTASVAAVVSERAALGSWVLAMPVVPALTVALGLWLVRRTEDVVAGTSVSLRVMPAVLGGAGLLSWILASFDDVAAALVPLGGALMVAGGIWTGAPGVVALALTTSVLTTAGLLFLTARDLDERAPRSDAHRVRPWRALADGGIAGALWWSLVPGPVLWAWAGNPGLTELLSPERGYLAGSAMLATLAGVRYIRTVDPSARPRLGGVSRRTVVGSVVIASTALLPLADLTHPWFSLARDRLSGGTVELGGLLFVSVLAQELWFRGWMQRRAGWWAPALVWAVVMFPFDPWIGLVSGLALGWAGKDGVLSSSIVRLAWLAAWWGLR